MSDIFTAAQSLIRNLNAPAQTHAVWVRSETEINEENGKEQATGKLSLCVSIRPTWKNKIKVPQQHDGHTVVTVPWPKDS